ncbi:LysR family transcriptional regulator, partial [Thiocystis violacea]|nr:LysR family transcriptional regulator [Thiocystis violacea]
CFVPERVAASYLRGGCLHRIDGAPTLTLPTYCVYPGDSDSTELATALVTLRALVTEGAAA